MKRTKTVRSMAAGLAAAMAFAGLGMGVALTANAVGEKPQISATEKGILKIHKLTPGSKTVAADGSEIEDVTTSLGAEAKPVEGVKFKIQRVLKEDKTDPIDLRTNDGWKEAAKFTQNANGTVDDTRLQAVAAYSEAVPTDAAGEVSFNNLDLGLYYVTEEIPATGVKVGGTATESNKLTPVKPFLVTLPMTNPAGNDWMYTVHVYPKNQPTDLKKTVVDDANKPVVSNDSKPVNAYKIEYGVPAPTTADGSYKQFMMVDVFKTGELVWDDTPASNVVYLVGAPDGNTKLTTNQLVTGDYKFVKKEDVATKKTYVTLVLEDSGLKKLTAARKADSTIKAVWELKAEVQPFTGDPKYKTIENETFAIPVDPDNTNFGDANWDPENPKPPKDDEIEKPKAQSKFGSVEIFKHDSKNTDTGLADAEFKLYSCGSDGVVADSAVALPVGEIKTNTEGKVLITGLRLNDFKDGESITDTSQQTYYCLVETKAPTGYSLLANPIKFQLLQKDFPEATGAANQKAVAQKIPNIKKNGGFELPITGGNGIVLIVISGGLLVAGSLFYAISSARKNRKES